METSGGTEIHSAMEALTTGRNWGEGGKSIICVQYSDSTFRFQDESMFIDTTDGLAVEFFNTLLRFPH
jgi:hypothetical protein